MLVNIHSGGYTTSGADEYPWGPIVDASRGSIIAVSTQYRLGGYRFLSGSEVRENRQANAGFLDQRAALEWVQRNIRSFGGDPSKVTILEGSAGGGSGKTLDTCTWKISHLFKFLVMDQMIMYGGVASPPFRAAISEYPWWQPCVNTCTACK